MATQPIMAPQAVPPPSAFPPLGAPPGAFPPLGASAESPQRGFPPMGAPPGAPQFALGPLAPPTPPISALPAFPGAASLYEQLDRRLLVVLRDGRHLVGVMRSYDQFANIVLEDTHERHFVGDLYGDIPLGLYIVRGDSVVLMGEMDDGREAATGLRKVSQEEILEAQQQSDADSAPHRVEWEFDQA